MAMIKQAWLWLIGSAHACFIWGNFPGKRVRPGLQGKREIMAIYWSTKGKAGESIFGIRDENASILQCSGSVFLRDFYLCLPGCFNV